MIEEPELAFLIVNVDEEHDEELDHDKRQFCLVTDQRGPIKPSYHLFVLLTIIELHKLIVPWNRESPVAFIGIMNVFLLEDDRIFHWVQLLVDVGQYDKKPGKEDYIHYVHDFTDHSWRSIEVEQYD